MFIGGILGTAEKIPLKLQINIKLNSMALINGVLERNHKKRR